MEGVVGNASSFTCFRSYILIIKSSFWFGSVNNL